MSGGVSGGVMRWLTSLSPADLITAMDEAPLSGFHFRAAVVSGWGSSPTPIDLFVIGIASR